MPWWGKSSDDDKSSKAGSEPASASGRAPFDPETLPQTRKLPEGLQKIVDKADEDSSIFDEITDGT